MMADAQEVPSWYTEGSTSDSKPTDKSNKAGNDSRPTDESDEAGNDLSWVHEPESASLIDSILGQIHKFLSSLDAPQLQGVQAALNGMGITAKRAGMAAAGGALAAVAAKQYQKRREAKRGQAKQRQGEQYQAEQGQARPTYTKRADEPFRQAWQLTSNEVAEAFGPNDVY